MRTPCLLLITALMVAPALAQEPSGCDKFKWPLDRERALLTGASIQLLASGATLNPALDTAAVIALVPFAEAKLPVPPERAPKAPTSFAGFVRITAPPTAAIYKVNLSAEGWIDLIQHDKFIKSGAFTGATDCDGIRKSVQFDLASAPFIVQLSAVRSDSIALTITASP
jgi:hypothetical protein